MKLIIQVVAGVLFLISNPTVSYAITIVDNVCDKRATLGAWQEGLGDKKDVTDVTQEFDT